MSTTFKLIERGQGEKRVAFEPEWFQQEVSTETKDLAKERGLIFFDEQLWKIVLTDDPAEYQDLFERFTLEEYLQYRLQD
jgi:hypothetical protein